MRSGEMIKHPEERDAVVGDSGAMCGDSGHGAVCSGHWRSDWEDMGGGPRAGSMHEHRNSQDVRHALQTFLWVVGAEPGDQGQF